jgi:leucyl aminopeptidase
LDEDNIKSNLAKLSSFYTRYYKSPSGKESSLWMFDKVNEIAQPSHINITTRLFEHSWTQKSVIASIPGKKSPDDIIVISAHQDSANLFFPMGLPAPGADDDGSGTVTVLEAFKVLVDSGFEPDNTVEFHWYSAEEGGLLGSQDVFTEYAAQAKKVRAMIHQDMTGYIKTRQDKGLPEAIGIIVDNVSEELTDFLKMLVQSYTDLPVVESRCGYACSDHASATKAGYPSAVLTESEFEYANPHVHNTEDTLDRLSFYHMAQIARVDVAGAYELAFYEF